MSTLFEVQARGRLLASCMTEDTFIGNPTHDRGPTDLKTYPGEKLRRGVIAYAIWQLIGIGMSLWNPAYYAELLPSLLGKGGQA